MLIRRLAMLLALLIVLGTCVPAAAAGAEPDIAAIFNAAAARRPRPGDWLEYVVAYRIDPLENSLGANPLPGLDGVDPATVDPLLPLPAFEPSEAWRSLPLRLEILDSDGDGLRARLRFAGRVEEVALPLAAGEPTALFHYPDPQPPVERSTQRIDGISREVTVERRRGENYGFARMLSPDLPFGLARFASRDVDLILVGAGSGQPPVFPLTLRDPVSPPPGLFYRGDG